MVTLTVIDDLCCICVLRLFHKYYHPCASKFVLRNVYKKPTIENVAMLYMLQKFRFKM